MASSVILICMLAAFAIEQIVEGAPFEDSEEKLDMDALCNNPRDPENPKCFDLQEPCCLKGASNTTFCCDENGLFQSSEYIRCAGGMKEAIGKCVDIRFEDERLDDSKIGEPEYYNLEELPELPIWDSLEYDYE